MNSLSAGWDILQTFTFFVCWTTLTQNCDEGEGSSEQLWVIDGHERHLACLTIILVERKWVFLWCNRHRFSALARKKETFQFTESNLTDKSGLLSGFQRFSKQDLGKWIYSVESNCLYAVSVLASFSFVIYFLLLFFEKIQQSSPKVIYLQFQYVLFIFHYFSVIVVVSCLAFL